MSDVTELNVNGETHALEGIAGQPLLGVLRERLGMTGTKFGCGEGRCGACTVLVGGIPRRSCVTNVSAIRGREVTTIESLDGQGPDEASSGNLHPLQEAFLDHGALQCGYCTPGMVMSALGLLERNPRPTTDEIVRFMDTNVCRCGVYGRIVAAIAQAAQVMEERDR